MLIYFRLIDHKYGFFHIAIVKLQNNIYYLDFVQESRHRNPEFFLDIKIMGETIYKKNINFTDEEGVFVRGIKIYFRAFFDPAPENLFMLQRH